MPSISEARWHCHASPDVAENIGDSAVCCCHSGVWGGGKIAYVFLERTWNYMEFIGEHVHVFKD